MSLTELFDDLEQVKADNIRLRAEIKDLLPTSLVSCPVCGISGVRPEDKMCDKCRIEQLEAENAVIKEKMRLHAGDCCSLNNEAMMFKDHWDEAEERNSKLQAELAEARKKPEPTEFTKIRRANAELLLAKYPRNETASQSELNEYVLLDATEVADMIFEDCDIIDRLEEKREHLLEKVALQSKEIDRLTAEKETWEKQKCGKGFNVDGAVCEHRHADIGHYISHYTQAKEIISKKQIEIDRLTAELQALKEKP